jgi:hypothetical protein
MDKAMLRKRSGGLPHLACLGEVPQLILKNKWPRREKSSAIIRNFYKENFIEWQAPKDCDIEKINRTN